MSEHRIPVSPVRIAVIQCDPQVGLEHCDGNLSRGLALAERAAGEGANLIVLPGSRLATWVSPYSRRRLAASAC